MSIFVGLAFYRLEKNGKKPLKKMGSIIKFNDE